MPKYFRAKADKGWSKASIYETIKDVIDEVNLDLDPSEHDQLKMFPIGKFTNTDCQRFVDAEFIINEDYDREDDQAGERDALALSIYSRVAKRLKYKFDPEVFSDLIG